MDLELGEPGGAEARRDRHVGGVAAAGPFANLLMALAWALLLKAVSVVPERYFSMPLGLIAEAGKLQRLSEVEAREEARIPSGVAEFDRQGNVISLEEKPITPKSNYAVTGLYYYDNTVSERARNLKPSPRGELEITDLNRTYLNDNQLKAEIMGRGYAWLDTGTHDSLIEAAQFIQTIEHRQGFKVACPEEIAFRKGWVSAESVQKVATQLSKNSYGQYLAKILQEMNASSEPIALSSKKTS